MTLGILPPALARRALQVYNRNVISRGVGSGIAGNQCRADGVC